MKRKQLLLKAPQEDEEERQEVTVNLAVPKQISTDAGVAVVSLEVEAFSRLKINIGGFSWLKRCFASLPTGFSKSSGPHCGTSWLVAVATGLNRQEQIWAAQVLSMCSLPDGCMK